MTRPKTTIAAQLNAAQLAICNTLADTEIQSLVSAYGYSAAKMNAGKELYEAAVANVNAQKAAAGTQQETTRELIKAEKSARDAYQALAKVARAVFVADKARLAALGLTGSMPLDSAGFLTAGYTLFNNAAGVSGLSDYGYDASRLQSERAKIADFDQANNRQEAAKGTAQQATHEQDTALESLNDWTAQYLKIAKVALREKRQLLEKLGVTVRTSKTAAQRAAPKKAAATRRGKQGT